ncbi:transglycosylase SLT domain-containing protein [Sporomusa aerivorans]|uniref:transglycosylase SLT domain-containing protein n=1 Tax=Sporomusa aerivorans TaxID=204936 RepID=UPI00352BAFB9
MIGEVIKQYLVSLGVQIDKPGFNQMQSTLNQTSSTVTAATSGWVKDFVKAGTLISTALASVSASIAGVMASAAKQDLAMEKYSRSMLVSKSAALEMKTAIDALGESVQDIQLTPELMQRYRALVSDGRNMKVGGDYEGTMKNFRDLIFEFTRVKQEASYALQWVGYYLMKHLSKPLADAKTNFKSFNDNLIKNMPVWTEKVARALVYIINVGKHFLDLLKTIGKTIYDVWDAFPRGIKIATAALAGFFMVLRASPLGRMVALVSSLLLMVDDYFGHMEGKQAAMGPVWDKLNGYMDTAKQKLAEWGEKLAPVWDAFVRYLDLAKDGVINLAGKFSDWIQEVGQSDALSEFIGNMKELGSAFYELGSGVIQWVSAAFHDLLASLQKHDTASKFTDLMGRLKGILWGLLGVFKDCIQTVAQWFSEIARSEEMQDFIDASVEMFGALMDLFNALMSLVTVAFSGFYGEMEKTQKAYTFRDAVRAVVGMISSMVRVISSVIELLAKFFKMMADSRLFKEFWRGMGQAVKAFSDIVFGAIGMVGKLGQALLALVRGDFKKAAKLAGDALLGKAEAGGKVNRNIKTKEEFFAAVAAQESGGNYSAQNERTGAFGKYQIMPENWSSWAATAGLSPYAEQTPENQEIVAKHILGSYFDEYGAEGAFVAWYAGSQNGARWRDGAPDAIGANGQHYGWDYRWSENEPSIKEYVEQALGKAGYISNEIQDVSSSKSAPEQPAPQGKEPVYRNHQNDMREPTWWDRVQDWWEQFDKPSSSSSDSGLVRPSTYFANGFANSDPVLLNNLMNGSYPIYAHNSGGGVTNITYQVEVGGVEVTNTNASPAEIGKAVGDKTASSINDRARYVLQNRTLNGIQV